MIDVSLHLPVQNIALQVLRDIAPLIKAGKTERNVAEECAQLLAQWGVTASWYHNVPALVLVGECTTLSVSGKDYNPSDLVIRSSDLVTIDLSPLVNDIWGDCARSYIIESGKVIPPDRGSVLDYGKSTQRQLHAFMREFATPDTSIHELYNHINQSIEDLDFKNLDYRGNLGHSIETNIDARRYIEANNHGRLGDIDLFTFEPHICRGDDGWGFKMENIYYFEDDRAVPLGSRELLEAVS